jgi:hypothetical protein
MLLEEKAKQNKTKQNKKNKEKPFKLFFYKEIIISRDKSCSLYSNPSFFLEKNF